MEVYQNVKLDFFNLHFVTFFSTTKLFQSNHLQVKSLERQYFGIIQKSTDILIVQNSENRVLIHPLNNKYQKLSFYSCNCLHYFLF